MDNASDDGEGSPRIDVRALPESVARLWETMLRLDPSWDISTWLDERANEELQLVEGQLGRERLRLEQRLHRLETLAKRLKRQREISEGVVWTDPHQKNLFDIYEPENKEIKASSDKNEEIEDYPAVDYTNLEISDDPLLAIVAEHVMHILESLKVRELVSIHFDILSQELRHMGIRDEEVDEAISWLLQREMIVELEQDYFALNI
jgi:hypothetical protein|tara:strand:+ start:2083 stop:2700 length:618 start_codon:yes stop_codon:yes gene_type:complete